MGQFRRGEGNAEPHGWLLSHGDKPARIPEEHSETAYTTRRAMHFIDEAAQDGRNWCLHLSYIKPHWPYIAPAPYHDLYGPARCHRGGALGGRARRSAPGLRRADGAAASRRLFARRGAGAGDPGLYGPGQADRRPAGRAVRLPRRARAVGQHHDRLHHRSRRLSRRPLARRKGFLPRLHR